MLRIILGDKRSTLIQEQSKIKDMIKSNEDGGGQNTQQEGSISGVKKLIAYYLNAHTIG